VAASDGAGLAGSAKADRARRLYKSREGFIIDGVCAGAAEYIGASPTAVRIAFVLLAFAGFWGGLLYILGMVLIPRSPADRESPRTSTADRTGWGGLVGGVGFGLMILGGLLFLAELGLIQWRFWRVWQIGFHAVWPLFLIVGGWVVVARNRATPASGEGQEGRVRAPFVRLRGERMIAGVCAGLARRLGLDVSAVRVLWAFFTVLSWGVGAVVYGVAVLLIEEDAAADRAPDWPSREDIPEKLDPSAPSDL